MAIRKNNSRASDRVKIKRFHAQGFDIEQISAKLSITPEHVQYVLTDYEAALERNIAAAQGKMEKVTLQSRADREKESFREAEELARRKDPNVPTVDLEAIKAEIRAELLAEMKKEVPVVEKETEDETEAEEKAPRKARRRRQAAA